MQNKPILNKSVAFAVRIVNLCKYLNDKKKEYVISKQILRSGTSIGANISEAYCASSKKDFIAKFHISFKECNETLYWLTLLKRNRVHNQKPTRKHLYRMSRVDKINLGNYKNQQVIRLLAVSY